MAPPLDNRDFDLLARWWCQCVAKYAYCL